MPTGHSRLLSQRTSYTIYTGYQFHVSNLQIKKISYGTLLQKCNQAKLKFKDMVKTDKRIRNTKKRHKL